MESYECRLFTISENNLDRNRAHFIILAYHAYYFYVLH